MCVQRSILDHALYSASAQSSFDPQDNVFVIFDVLAGTGTDAIQVLQSPALTPE